jgi:Tfp pilus assembly protein FimT
MQKQVCGFTLMELLASAFIMLVIAGVIIANQGKFNSSAALTNLAYETALLIREAQVYGISVREFSSSAQVSYGVWFSNAAPTQYILFADQNGNQKYDVGEAVETATIGRGNRIGGFCGITGVSQTCAPTITELSILFTRPNPDAIVVGVSGGGSTVSYQSARITLSSQSGQTRCVSILPTGQVAVENVCL